MAVLVDELEPLGRGTVELETLVGGGRCRRGRAACGQEDAEREENGGEDVEGRTPRSRAQSSSSPGGRNVKGRSARVISVEAIQRVRPSKTGASVAGSSSCCSLKRTDPS